MSVFIGDTQGTYLSLLPNDLVPLLSYYLSSTVRIEVGRVVNIKRLRIIVGAYASPWLEGTTDEWKGFLFNGNSMVCPDFHLTLYGDYAYAICPEWTLKVGGSHFRKKLESLLQRPRLPYYLIYSIFVCWMLVMGLV